MAEDIDKGGRPPFYETPEELQKKIDEYFAKGFRTRKMVVGNKRTGTQVVEVPIITITGLVLYCGFCDRHSFYDYEKREGFSHTVKRARTFIEQEYEELLSTGNATGAIFALKNFGWIDKTETETTLKVGNIDKVDSLLNELATETETGNTEDSQ
jgi:hypothetical protein